MRILGRRGRAAAGVAVRREVAAWMLASKEASEDRPVLTRLGSAVPMPLDKGFPPPTVRGRFAPEATRLSSPPNCYSARNVADVPQDRGKMEVS